MYIYILFTYTYIYLLIFHIYYIDIFNWITSISIYTDEREFRNVELRSLSTFDIFSYHCHFTIIHITLYNSVEKKNKKWNKSQIFTRMFTENYKWDKNGKVYLLNFALSDPHKTVLINGCTPFCLFELLSMCAVTIFTNHYQDPLFLSSFSGEGAA